MNCSQTFNVMVNQFSFGNKRNITIATTLKRKFTCKCNKVSGHTEICFVFTNVERGTFNQMHINMVCLSSKLIIPYITFGLLAIVNL